MQCSVNRDPHNGISESVMRLSAGYYLRKLDGLTSYGELK